MAQYEKASWHETPACRHMYAHANDVRVSLGPHLPLDVVSFALFLDSVVYSRAIASNVHLECFQLGLRGHGMSLHLSCDWDAIFSSLIFLSTFVFLPTPLNHATGGVYD
jgi:hypothetical protein